jgi:hypothetical protein
VERAGYVRLRAAWHPNSNANGYVYEHVFVMSQVLGRALEADERVHHKNGRRNDNRPENLELWAVLSQPAGQRVEDLTAWAREVLARYEPDGF